MKRIDPEPVADASEIRELARSFDHNSPEYASAPHQILASLRRGCPVAHSDNYGGFWILTTYDDVANAARNDARFSSAFVPNTNFRGVSSPPGLSYRSGFIEIDPPESLKVRRIVNPFLSPKAVEAARPVIHGVVTEAIDAIIQNGQADLVQEFCELVPAKTVMTLMGLPHEQWRKFVEHFHHVVQLEEVGSSAERQDGDPPDDY